MWDISIFGYSFFYLFYNFFIYSFFGWIYESCLMSIKEKTIVNRGFFNGPFIPLYGAGATIVYMVFEPFKNNLFIVYFGGMILATVLEFITSIVMEKLFHAIWWDYSEYKFNFQGRIWIVASLFWGVLSIVMIEVLQPFVNNIILSIPIKEGKRAGYIILILFIADLILTVVATIDLDKKIADMQKLREDIYNYLLNTKLVGTAEELKVKFENHSILETIDNIKSKLGENLEKFTGSKDEKEKIKGLLIRYYKKDNIRIHKRLIKAFPRMKVKNREKAFKDFKEKIKNLRKR